MRKWHEFLPVRELNYISSFRGGTDLVGMWKAFLELIKLGWLEDTRLPKMVSVQSDGCAPIVKAFPSGAEKSEF
jgi:threonine synthase